MKFVEGRALHGTPFPATNPQRDPSAKSICPLREEFSSSLSNFHKPPADRQFWFEEFFNWDTNPHTPRLYCKPAPPLLLPRLGDGVSATAHIADGDFSNAQMRTGSSDSI